MKCKSADRTVLRKYRQKHENAVRHEVNIEDQKNVCSKR